MEITKVNEQYNINGILENGWKVLGNITNETNNEGEHLHVNINIEIKAPTTSEESDKVIGHIYYFKPVSGNIQISYSCSEELRDEMTQKVDTIIDFVLDYFKNN
jgi:hypothetical protein